jgi:hypothetical protein
MAMGRLTHIAERRIAANIAKLLELLTRRAANCYRGACARATLEEVQPC